MIDNLMLKRIVKESLKKICENDRILFRDTLSEQCICSKLAHYMSLEVENNIPESPYKVDTEYNRGLGGAKKLISVKDSSGTYILNKILCDLVVHCRGEKFNIRENLIAIEMKKTSDCKRKVKNEGIEGENCTKKEANFMRLIALTERYKNALGYRHIKKEHYDVYEWPQSLKKLKKGLVYVVEGFEVGFFIELIDKGDRMIPLNWNKDSITGLEITFFTRGVEHPSEKYIITFNDNSYTLSK